MKKSFLTRICLLICIVALSVAKCFGQADLKPTLLKDIVKTENGKFIAEEYGILVTQGKILEVKFSAVSPSDIISRDNFISIFSSFSNSLIVTTLRINQMKVNGDLIITRRDKSSKPADITVQIEMNIDGLRYKVNAKDYTASNNIDWDQFFQAITK